MGCIKVIYQSWSLKGYVLYVEDNGWSTDSGGGMVNFFSWS